MDEKRVHMETLEKQANDTATEALTNAMYRHTFGIVGDGKGHAEGKGIGTGIGLYWRHTFLILTAPHVVEQVPSERLFFLLPNDGVQFQDSRLRTEPNPVTLRKRVSLENSAEPLLADDEKDIAAFRLPDQAEELGRGHFYHIDESHVTANENQQIGFLGYPASTSLRVGANVMATPYSSFGKRVTPLGGVDPTSQISVSYPAANSVDPRGLSGSGLWKSTMDSFGGLLTPRVSLIGMVTHWDPKDQVIDRLQS